MKAIIDAGTLARALYSDPTGDVSEPVAEFSGPLTERLMATAPTIRDKRAYVLDVVTTFVEQVRPVMALARDREALALLEAASARSLALVGLRVVNEVVDTLARARGEGDSDVIAFRRMAHTLRSRVRLDERVNPRPDRP